MYFCRARTHPYLCKKIIDMADRNQTQVDLLMNGQQAEQELSKLRKRADELVVYILQF